MKVIQGDVIIRKVEALPEGLKKLEGKVLQESEVTGHHHHFAPDAEVEVYQRDEKAGEQLTITPNMGKYIVVEGTSLLYHGKEFELDPNKTGNGDHKALTIEPGIYEIDIVREYDYDAMETRRVVD